MPSGVYKRSPRPPRPINHGTYGGYNAHLRRGERPCDRCRTAQRAYYQANLDKQLARSKSYYWANREAIRARYAETSDVRRAAYRQANPLAELQCPTCGVTFIQRRRDQRYCCPEHGRAGRWSNDRERGTTSQRGYGGSHQADRRAALAAFRPGQLCGYCGEPIWDTHNVALAHNADRSTYLGLWHAACNNREAAIRANRSPKRKRPAPPRRITA